MPVHKITLPNGTVGYKWGEHGSVYTGPMAKEKAAKQGQAAFANGYKVKTSK